MKRRTKTTLLTLPFLLVLTACSYDTVKVTTEGEDYLGAKYPDRNLKIAGVVPNEPFLDKGYKYLIEDDTTGSHFTAKSEELITTATDRVFTDNLIQRENGILETTTVESKISTLLKGVYYLVADVRVYDKEGITTDNNGNITSKGDISTTQTLTNDMLTNTMHKIEGGMVNLVVSQTLTTDQAKTILDTLTTHFGDVTLTVYTYNSDTQVEYVRHLHSSEGVSINEAAPKNVRVSSDMYYYDGKGTDAVFTHVDNVK